MAGILAGDIHPLTPPKRGIICAKIMCSYVKHGQAEFVHATLKTA